MERRVVVVEHLTDGAGVRAASRLCVSFTWWNVEDDISEKNGGTNFRYHGYLFHRNVHCAHCKDATMRVGPLYKKPKYWGSVAAFRSPKNGEGPAPPLPCAVGDVLPLSPGPRTLVAIQGTPGPEGSVVGKPFVAWGAHLHAWMRKAVSVDSAAVASRVQLELQVEPGRPLRVTARHLYQDAQGRWFGDEDARPSPLSTSDRWPWWYAAGGAAAAALATGFWALRRRRRAPG